MLVISAHWEAEKPTVTLSPAPPLIYDYTNFPAHTYSLRYHVPGAPALAARVRDLLATADIASGADPERGLDHGVFVPFRLMYPEADIPLVQLSLQSHYDPTQHLAIGAALAPLRDEGVLIVGSGMSFHHLGTLGNGIAAHAERFDAWLTAAVTGDPTRRAELLSNWQSAPSARDAHPEEEHLAPLFVVAGAARRDAGTVAYHGSIWNKPISGYRFG